ncbi:MAG: peptidoglycan DD-metalloendopeptidase family protein [bacterium]
MISTSQKKSLLLAILGLSIVAPLGAFAQGATTVATSSAQVAPFIDLSYEAGLLGGIERQQAVKSWRNQPIDIQQKIDALGPTAIASVSVPILFGVDLKDITANFGVSRDHGARSHEGEDIMAIKGTPIVSPTSAVVLRIGTGTTEGNFVSTANPGGETFVYMHLDTFAEGLKVGDVLEGGDLIGYIGDTGNALGGPVHLHFEIRNQIGVATDPYLRLKAELTLQQKMYILEKILRHSRDMKSLSQFLVLNFRPIFNLAQSQGIALPAIIATTLSPTLNTIATTTTPIIVTSVPSTLVLPRNLKMRMRGDDVKALQSFLNLHGFSVAPYGIGSRGYETGYFGPATRAAVIKFQMSQSIFPRLGFVGFLTRTAISNIHS